MSFCIWIANTICLFVITSFKRGRWTVECLKSCSWCKELCLKPVTKQAYAVFKVDSGQFWRENQLFYFLLSVLFPETFRAYHSTQMTLTIDRNIYFTILKISSALSLNFLCDNLRLGSLRVSSTKSRRLLQ